MDEIEAMLLDSSLTIEQKITALSKKRISVPEWHILERQYDPLKHPVRTDPEYTKGKKKEKVSQITLGWQKLAVKRMAALLCGIPVKRVYSPQNDAEKKAARILEGIYNRNRIDSINLERARYLYAACENVSIWFTQEADAVYGGEHSKLKLRCRNYSPIKGDQLYPLFDEYDDLVALSVKYTRNEDEGLMTYFDTYTANRHICWNVTAGVEVLNEEIKVAKIPGVYTHRNEPIWEGESENVYEAEWTYSRNGNYIRKNARPLCALYTDNEVEKDKSPKGDATARDIIRLGKGDKLEYVTWQGSTEAIKFHIEELKHNFNSQIQLPDMSMDNMKSSPMSGESRKMLFMDAQMKVTDESGIWVETYDRELNVIRAYAKLMFPGLSSAFDTLAVEHVITPYQIRDEKENVETLATAAGTIASKLTCIRRLGWAEDADAELELINNEQGEDIFNQVQ